MRILYCVTIWRPWCNKIAKKSCHIPLLTVTVQLTVNYLKPHAVFQHALNTSTSQDSAFTAWRHCIQGWQLAPEWAQNNYKIFLLWNHPSPCVLINMCYSVQLNFPISLTMTGFTNWRQFEFVEFKLEFQMSHILSSWHCSFKRSVRPSSLILLHVYLIYTSMWCSKWWQSSKTLWKTFICNSWVLQEYIYIHDLFTQRFLVLPLIFSPKSFLKLNLWFIILWKSPFEDPSRSEFLILNPSYM